VKNEKIIDERKIPPEPGALVVAGVDLAVKDVSGAGDSRAAS
jgi:hypothetical protein